MRAFIFKPSLEVAQADAAALGSGARRQRGPRAHRPAVPEVHRLFAQDAPHRFLLVAAVWSSAVGADLLRRTRPETLEAGVLRVRVPDWQWRQVLHRMQPQLLAQLRAVLGDLAPRRLSFVEGGLEDSTATALPPPPPVLPLQMTLPPSVARAAAAIEDAEIRARFEQTAARYLARPTGRA